MILAKRDIIQFRELKKISIVEYLVLLDNFAKEVEPENDHPVAKKKNK